MQFFYFAFVVALAGRAMAFTFLTLGTTNFNTTEILAVPAGPVKDSCASTCDPANTKLQACNGQTPCQCALDVVDPIRECEQCWFTELIKRNQAAPDPRMASTPLLQAYSAACAAENITLAKTALALTLPEEWNGPYGLFLNKPATAFGVIMVACMGVSAIWLLSNM